GAGALVLAARARTASELLFYQGATLFVLAAASLVLTARRMGAAETVLESGFDLTYFVFSIPLLLLSLTSFSFRPEDAASPPSRRGVRGPGPRRATPAARGARPTAGGGPARSGRRGGRRRAARKAARRVGRGAYR